MEELQKAYFKNTEKPKYYCDEMNIAIHIRTGFDLVPSDVNRIIPMSVYNKIIVKIKEKYPKAKLHVFSWYDIKLDNQEIIYHISNDGGFFLDDFNGLVYSDLLVIGSSSFSMSAGLFNKGIVICNEELFKCTDPIPTQWIDNYNKILK